jgi:Domain of unknown function (DUF397)
MGQNNSPGTNESKGYPGATWKKSSYSEVNGHCLQTARISGDLVAVRDSQAENGPALCFKSEAWVAFIATVRSI